MICDGVRMGLQTGWMFCICSASNWIIDLRRSTEKSPRLHRFYIQNITQKRSTLTGATDWPTSFFLNIPNLIENQFPISNLSFICRCCFRVGRLGGWCSMRLIYGLLFLVFFLLFSHLHKGTRPDTRPPVAGGWAGAEMRVSSLFDSCPRTNRPTDGRTKPLIELRVRN